MEKNIQWIKSKQPCPKLKLKMEGKKRRGKSGKRGGVY